MVCVGVWVGSVVVEVGLAMRDGAVVPDATFAVGHSRMMSIDVLGDLLGGGWRS